MNRPIYKVKKIMPYLPIPINEFAFQKFLLDLEGGDEGVVGVSGWGMT